jgi:hypothetical protein
MHLLFVDDSHICAETLVDITVDLGIPSKLPTMAPNVSRSLQPSGFTEYFFGYLSARCERTRAVRPYP